MSAPGNDKQSGMDTRFKPGQSGNPKGRPRNSPRAEIPMQLGMDIRAVGRRKTTVNTPEGPLRVTLFEAYTYRLWMDAIGGKISQQRLLLGLLRDAYADNIAMEPILHLMDSGANSSLHGTIDGEMRARFFEYLAGRSRLSPSERVRSNMDQARPLTPPPSKPEPDPNGGSGRVLVEDPEGEPRGGVDGEADQPASPADRPV